jgi:hypothetical protein
LNVSTFPVVILNAARAFGKLHMLVGRPSLLEKERRTLEPLRTVAVGVVELFGGRDEQADGTVRGIVR